MVFWFTRCADSSRYQSKTFLQPCVFVREQLLETPVHYTVLWAICLKWGKPERQCMALVKYITPPPPATSPVKKERNFGRDRMQSHMWLTTNSYMTKYLRRFFLSYDFAPDPFRNSLYMRKIFPNFCYECAGASVCWFFSVKVRPVRSFFQFRSDSSRGKTSLLEKSWNVHLAITRQSF